MLKKIGIGLLVVLLGFVIVVALQPSAFRIERSQSIDAPAYVAFNIINNFRRWPAWSPWEQRDPNLQRTYSGSEVGVGAVYEWSGNDDVGAGRMTIIESDPEKRIAIRLEFLKPWTATNTTLFLFEPAGSQVTVTWAMEGENNFMAKAASLFMDMDALVGKDFEKGLATLQKVSEQEAREIERAKAKKAKLAAEAAAKAAPAEGGTAPSAPSTGEPSP